MSISNPGFGSSGVHASQNAPNCTRQRAMAKTNPADGRRRCGASIMSRQRVCRVRPFAGADRWQA